VIIPPRADFATMKRPGGRFNLSKGKTEVEWKIHNAKDLPGETRQILVALRLALPYRVIITPLRLDE
jgi:hypothetical protein